MNKIDENKIRELVNVGLSIKDISKSLSISINSVKKCLKELELKTVYKKHPIIEISKLDLENLLKENSSLRSISKLTGKSLTSIRYWIKKYQLSLDKSKIPHELKSSRFCPRCCQEKGIQEFYKKRGIQYASSYCKSCTTRQTVERMINFKSLCVEYKGGKCIVCGYNKYHGALEFHHMNPDDKDFTISQMRKYSFDNLVKFELDKCVLLCANCHREVENGLVLINEKSSQV